MNIDIIKLRKQIKATKAEKKLTYKEIASDSGISYCGVWNFLNNATEPRDNILRAMYAYAHGKHYNGAECNQCKSKLRYVRNDNCVECTRHNRRMSYFRKKDAQAESKGKNRILTEQMDTPPSLSVNMPVMSMHWCSVPSIASTRYNPNPMMQTLQ